MALVIFKCKWCSATIAAADNQVGRMASCPECHKLNRVPKCALGIKCPQCSCSLQVSKTFLGGTIFCPECRNEIDLGEGAEPDVEPDVKPDVERKVEREVEQEVEREDEREGGEEAEEETSFECPSCSSELSAALSAIGETFDCPSCGKPVQVPAVIQNASSEPKLRLKDQAAHAPVDQRFSLYDAAYGEARKDKSGGCPRCGNVLPTGAVICVNCGVDFRSRRWKRLAALRSMTTFSARSFVVFLFRVFKGLLIAGLVLALAWFTLRQHLAYRERIAEKARAEEQAKKGEQQYQYITTKLRSVALPAEKVALLRSYLDEFPEGEHSGKIKAMLEDAERQQAAWEAAQKAESPKEDE